VAESISGIPLNRGHSARLVQTEKVTAMPNVQVSFDTDLNNARSESSLAINPNNTAQIVAASKKFADIHTYNFTLATEYSTDGGQTWSPSSVLDLPAGATVMTDPTLAWDDSNNVFLVGLTGFNPPAWDTIGIVIYKSSDGGQTWSPPNPIHNSPGDDKQWAAGDAYPGSPFHGNVYAIWDNGGLAFARTTDHGASWQGTAGEAAGNIISTGTVYPEITVSDDGTVYVVSTDAVSDIEILASTDGGASFAARTKPATGITSLETAAPRVDGWPVLPGGSFRVITDPTIASRGGITVVAWADYRDQESRIYFVRSTDGGVSWSTPSGQPLLTRTVPSGFHHVMPQMVVDSSGVFGCVYYEFGPKPTTNLIDVIISMSFDGGMTFDYSVVTDQPWDPTIDAPWSHGDPAVTFIGDYMGLDANPQGFHPVWTDTRTGIQELFTSTVPTCVVEFLDELDAGELTLLRSFRDETMTQSHLGQQISTLVGAHQAEVTRLLAADDELRGRAADVLRRTFALVKSSQSPDPARVDEGLVRDIEAVADRLAADGSASLRRDIRRLRSRLQTIRGKTASELLD
jgi:BNR/Asp-box repeat